MKSEIENRLKKLEEYKKRNQTDREKFAEFLAEKITGFVPFWDSYEIGYHNLPDDCVGIFGNHYIKIEDARKNRFIKN